MLPNSRRLKKTDFESLKKIKGRILSSSGFNLRVYEINPELVARFAVVVPSSVSKKATERNKLKRKIKGFISRNLKNFKNGLVVVVYVKKQTTEKELQIIFKEANILK